MDASEHPEADFVLQCPQFDKTLSYSREGTTGVRVANRHPYFEAALRTAMALAAAKGHRVPRLVASVKADNEFYSQQDRLEALGLARGSSSLRALQKFEKCGAELGELRKTGLGSSAALVTSLLTCLLAITGELELKHKGTGAQVPKERLEWLHNLSQFAHCLAQGKVGSGFDVSSAVFGSQRFTRASSSILAPLLSAEDPFEPGVLKAFAENLSIWDNVHDGFCLPKGMRLLMGDVNAGSSTPGMVKAVLRWLDTTENAAAVWGSLAEKNAQVAALLSELQQLATSSPEAYSSSLATLATTHPTHWAGDDAVAKACKEARSAFLEVRLLLRAMGEAAGVDIEPEPQGRLLDRTMSLPGVLFAGVPGAGGNDAVFAVVIAEGDQDATMAAVEELWLSSSELSVLPTIVREGTGGVVVESVE